MKTKHNYVECHNCKWRLEHQPDFDWAKNPCRRCNNVREIIDPKEVLCNMCGEGMCHNIEVPSGLCSTDDPHGLYDAKVQGGYDSYHLLDMNEYTFSFCEKCLRQLFIQCKIKPDVVYIAGGHDEYGWKQDQEGYEYRVWCDAGYHHQAYLDRKCNIVKDCPNRAEYTRLCNDHFDEDCCCEEHKPDYSGRGSYSLTKFIPNVLKPFL